MVGGISLFAILIGFLFNSQTISLHKKMNQKVNGLTKQQNVSRLRKLDDEIWKPLDFTDKKYEISNYGRIKSYCFDKKNGRIIRCRNVGGFMVVDMIVKEHRHHFCVHKLTAETFLPPPEEGQTVVIHLDWNKKNNYYKNLSWVSKEESYKRMHARLSENRKKSGKRVTNSRLKNADILVLKEMLQKGVKQKVIAKLFRISEMQVTRIKRGENWADVVPLNQGL